MSIRNDTLIKLQRYCAYQERCHSQVRSKLIELKVFGEELEQVISDLIRDDFLNEQRFAESFAGGKFRIKKWGRQKIKNHLKAKKVSEYCIAKGLAVIDSDDYLITLQELITKYQEQRINKGWSHHEMRKKCMLYCQNKGYEYALIQQFL